VRRLKRLQKVILSRGGQSAISSIQLENGEYTTSERETLEELLQVHFPGFEMILEPSGGWDGLELAFPKNGEEPGKTGRSPKGS
jgi:hypothetical protein